MHVPVLNIKARAKERTTKGWDHVILLFSQVQLSIVALSFDMRNEYVQIKFYERIHNDAFIWKKKDQWK